MMKVVVVEVVVAELLLLVVVEVMCDVLFGLCCCTRQICYEV